MSGRPKSVKPTPSKIEFKEKIFQAAKRYSKGVDDALSRGDWEAVSIFGHRRDAVIDLIHDCELVDLYATWWEEHLDD